MGEKGIVSRLIGALLLVFLACFTFAGCNKISVPEGSTVILNGTVIDGTGKEPVAKGLVVIKEGKIWAVGPEKHYALPRDIKVLDAGKGYILPSLINTHVHITNTKTLKSFTKAGVTTLRDLGGPKGIVLARKYDRTLGEPRLLAAGPIITVPGGYPTSSWGERVALTIKSPREAKVVVEGLAEEGIDVIKIAITEGTGSKPLPTLSLNEIKAITSTAHNLGLKVVAHVLRTNDVRRALEGGVDQLAHDVVDELPQDLLITMVKQDVILIPTLEVLLEGIEDSDFSEGEKEQAKNNLFSNVRRFLDMGGKIALGDDYGVVGVERDLPLGELQLMQEAGMSPAEIIVAATRDAALAIGKEGELGTLEGGKAADVLVVKENPLKDCRNLAAVKGIIFKGQPLIWQ